MPFYTRLIYCQQFYFHPRHNCILPGCTCYYGKPMYANHHCTATAKQPWPHQNIHHCQSQIVFQSWAGAKQEGYITDHKACQMCDLSQHPMSKFAWDLLGPSAVQQCQHNDQLLCIAIFQTKALLQFLNCGWLRPSVYGLNLVRVSTYITSFHFIA